MITEPGHVVLTDRAWPDARIEEEVCARHGWELVDAEGLERSELLRLVRSAVGVLTNWASVDRQLIEAAPGLRAICRMGVGVDNIDLQAAADHGVAVSRVPDYCLEEIADHVVALTLSWARSLRFYDSQAHAGRWLSGAREQRRVSRLGVGVWGAGSSGRQVATRFAALGCAVLVDDRHGAPGIPDVRAVPVDDLLASTDVLTLHLPLNDQTRGIVDAGALAALPDGALVVNTSRGGVLDLDALRKELESERLAAALDVLPDEPSIPRWMLGLENILITPHVAFSSRESVADVRRRAAEDLVAVLGGEPPAHPVSIPTSSVPEVLW